MRRSAIWFTWLLTLGCCATAAWPADQPWDDPRAAELAQAIGTAEPSAWLDLLDPAGQGMATFVLTRRLALMVPLHAEIPFAYLDRPTIDCWIGGCWLPLLFNTGTNTCILWQGEDWPALSALHWTAFSPVLAALEGKPRVSESGQRLDYARAVLVDAGPVSLFNVPFRVYSGGEYAERDFAGALAPIAWREYLIEVNNTKRVIRLHERKPWLPPPGTRALPLLSLPRGIFVPLWLGDAEAESGMELYWFHLDTGFSGSLAVVPGVRAEHPGWFTPLPGTPQEFTGWHEQFSYEPLSIGRLELRPLPVPGCPNAEPLVFTAEDGLAYRDAYAELEGYHIGGIVGSGFLQRFNYVLDYELARLYLLP